jgi:hypothetical protein
MKHAVTRELYDYWNRLRGDRLSPERGEIDPTVIRGILADTFILEVDGERHFPFRLSGTRSNAIFMQELKGLSFLDLWASRDRGDIATLLAAVCDDAAGLVAGVITSPAGREPIELELLLLPVRHHGKTHARMLGSLAPRKLASWMGLLPAEHLSLQAFRILPLGRYAEPRSEEEAIVAISGAAPGTSASSGPGPTRYGHFFVHHTVQ